MNRPQEIDVIRDFAINLLKRNSLSELLWEIAHSIGSLPEFEDSVVYLVEGHVLVQRAAYGVKQGGDRVILNPIEIPIGSGIVGTVAATGVAEIVWDTHADPRYIHDEYSGRSELTVPVVYADRVIAVLDTEHRNVGAYSEADLSILQTMANISASRIASAVAEENTREARHALEELNRELESRVEERTSELQAVNSAVGKERDRLVSILASIRNGLICVDGELKVRLISPSAEELTGWKNGSAIGEHLSDVFKLDGQKPIDDLIALHASAPGVNGQETMEGTLLSKTGTKYEVSWNVGTTPTTLDGPGERVVVFSDQTQQNQLARQAERVDRMQSLGVLAGGIAHDFNNNLTAIQAALDTVAISAGTESSAALELASQACQEAQTLTGQFLTFAKGSAPVRIRADLAEILKTSANLAASGRRTSIELNLPGDLCAVDVDPGQMIQVFNNLFLNAIQAMPHGGQIFVTATEHSGPSRERTGDSNERFVTVEVRDQGTGIANELLESIFEPYFTGRKDGTGLGLTTAFFILSSHGGSITAENCPDGGALFTVTIPGIDRAEHEEPQSQDQPSSSGLGVLIVDDEEMVRRGVKMLIESLGHRVWEAATGEEALKIANAAENTVDVALLDLTMREGMGGEETVVQLKSIRPLIKCAVCSGYHHSPILSQFREYGFDAVLPKPFNRGDLVRVFNELMGGD